MGPYELSAEPAHGYPRYSKRAAGGATHWLYRGGVSGKWYVTNDESKIAKNAGYMQVRAGGGAPHGGGAGVAVRQ